MSPPSLAQWAAIVTSACYFTAAAAGAPLAVAGPLWILMLAAIAWMKSDRYPFWQFHKARYRLGLMRVRAKLVAAVAALFATAGGCGLWLTLPPLEKGDFAILGIVAWMLGIAAGLAGISLRLVWRHKAKASRKSRLTGNRDD